MNREVVNRRFNVRSDNGTIYNVIEYQEMVSFAHHQDANAEKPGMKRLVTSDGSPVNFIDNETFMIASTGEIVRLI